MTDESYWYYKRPMIVKLVEFGWKNLVGCEVGVYKGRNAGDMLRHLDIKTLYLVDIDLKQCDDTRVVQDLKEEVKWIEKKSQEVTTKDIPELLDFVYIDADHHYEPVKKDIETYWPMVKPGGLMGGHDFFGNGKRYIEDAVGEFIYEKRLSGTFFAAAGGYNQWNSGVYPSTCSDWWIVKPRDMSWKLKAIKADE